MTGATNLSHFLKNIAPLCVKNNVACFAAHLSTLIVMRQFFLSDPINGRFRGRAFNFAQWILQPWHNKNFCVASCSHGWKSEQNHLQYCIKSCTNLLPIFPSTILPSSLSMISPYVRESKTVLDSIYRFQVLDSECFVSETWILDSLSCILNYKAQDPGFHSKNLLDSRNKKQKFPSFWNQNSHTWCNRLDAATFRV